LVATAGSLQDRLGAVLFQLPPNFKKDLPRLRDFLPLASGCRVAFEFRHPSWFDDDALALLREHRAALCLADAGDELEVPFVATADWGYLRLRRPDYDDAALAGWAGRIRGQAWQDVFVFFKHEDAAAGPRMAARLAEFLAEGAARGGAA
jgi:uncharacterized protein YecE (DUF72 family)